ncbi:hypothetical protein HDU83_007140 [Entophlyctis luteolus]|nr:hypothetical protein HDU82_005124 [Entophlyctis luteolus]KAJ3353160.1 hypothetical protein HDU83_007140 [Entophlyctis luteolus]KAJ3390010.1 hypothetical protein HDU84_008069 [Entophlyctis sp. JEL0112]
MIADEKGDVPTVAEEKIAKRNPHQPFPDDMPAEQQLTVRACVIGVLVGGIICASNVYLGLKTGFTFGAGLVGAIFGFGIVKPLSNLPWYFGGGSYFGPKENCTVQTVATATSALGSMWVSAIPAMYQLGLLGASPVDDAGRLISLAVVTSYYGLFFAVPLRRYFVIKYKLTFPSPTAAAVTIRSMHDSVGGAEIGKKQALVTLVSFVGAMLFCIAQWFAPGILHDWHIGYWIAHAGVPSAIAMENWAWVLEWTPAFFGAGMLSGPNASYSMFFGSLLAYGILGPQLVKNGLAVGRFNGGNATKLDEWLYFGSNPIKGRATPRFWMLWPGVAMMLAHSLAEMAMNYKSLANAIRLGIAEIVSLVTRKENTNTEVDDEDPATPAERVATWEWVLGVFISMIFSIVVLKAQFDVPVGHTILAVILAFLFSFIGIQASGDTDINPISAVAKLSQLVFGGITKGQGLAVAPAQTINLVAGSVAGSAAYHSADMVGDLKTGYLLNASPRSQFYGQVVGALFSAFIGFGVYVVFSKAYPCINDASYDECAFGIPSVSAWAAVAKVLTDSTISIPDSSLYAALVFMILAVLTTVVKHFWIPSKYHVFVPNWTAMGVAFVLNTQTYSIAMAIGATFAIIWGKWRPNSYELFGLALASGLTAGEGFSGLITAIFSVAGLDNSVIGTSIGCTLDGTTGEYIFCG